MTGVSQISKKNVPAGDNDALGGFSEAESAPIRPAMKLCVDFNVRKKCSNFQKYFQDFSKISEILPKIAKGTLLSFVILVRISEIFEKS